MYIYTGKCCNPDIPLDVQLLCPCSCTVAACNSSTDSERSSGSTPSEPCTRQHFRVHRPLSADWVVYNCRGILGTRPSRGRSSKSTSPSIRDAGHLGIAIAPPSSVLCTCRHPCHTSIRPCLRGKSQLPLQFAVCLGLASSQAAHDGELKTRQADYAFILASVTGAHKLTLASVATTHTDVLFL